MTDTDERYTPEHILDVVRRFGPIACDPCTTEGNRTRAKTHYTAETDGLAQTWPAGVVWVNPPYSRGSLYPWVLACSTWGCLDGRHIIALIPSDLGSAAGARAAETASALCFVRGRIRFDSPEGPAKTGAKQPSIIVYWGDGPQRFADIFRDLGSVWKK
jgi:phage N-6-adenine-methyltransferase